MATCVAMAFLLLAGCGTRESPPAPPTTNPIQSANAFFQGNKLYAQVSLDPMFMTKIKRMFKQGEPLMASYHFRLIRTHPWLPDTRVLQHQINRHMRLRLITQRYELRDTDKKQLHYAANESEAMQFFGNPRFILLHNHVKLLPDVTYQLETHLAITHEGMSRLFQFLDRWLSLNQSLRFVHLTNLTANERLNQP